MPADSRFSDKTASVLAMDLGLHRFLLWIWEGKTTTEILLFVTTIHTLCLSDLLASLNGDCITASDIQLQLKESIQIQLKGSSTGLQS